MRLAADVHGTGPRVVLVHGFTQTARSWAPLVPRFTASHEVVAVDAPAHGRSSGVRVGLWEGARLLGETAGRAAYVGYSMGGRLALHLALAEPALVERIVLVGATAGLDTEEDRAARRAADEGLAAALERDGLEPFLTRWLANPLFATLPPEAAAMESRRENDAAALAASLRLMGTGTQEPLWDRLGELRMPALFVTGALDEKFTAIANRMAAAWGGEAAVETIAAAGHAVHLERPDAFAGAVLAFLHDTTSPAASSAP